jgi:hypothetical protein
MANKLVIKVSPELTDNANYKNLNEIPSSYLSNRGTSVLVYPGTYAAPTAGVYDDVAFIGVGDRDEVVINGDMVVANTSANVVTFKNLTFTGSNAVAGSASTCVTKVGTTAVPLHFYNCAFTGADYAVRHNANLAAAAGVPQVVMKYCDATGVDKVLVANANVEVSFSELNLSSNAYFAPGTGGGAATVTVTASTSGGSNAGISVEVIRALIS